ncbi:UvrD-helicase domain-containing protein [Pseudomonas sp. LRF_L74]|uniref:UvrD-helicase domain-containing protein n=1 Tax=Pseudomonas sp. LRF_L74 TaxID=3369422 RepID=UPI003F60C301
MLSTLARYKRRFHEALVRCFPRTSAYLHAEREAAQQRNKPAPRTKKKAAASKRKPASQSKAKGEKTAAKGLYPATRMKVTAAQEQAMRAKVAEAVSAGVVSAPSDEQWAMILARQPATRIFAGAGSGKSTTLVLRVVFMLCHLDIEVEKLTVISFTNASCAQLREQLCRTLAFWQFAFDASQARQSVRTFHSAMAVLARDVLGNPAWFEQMGDKAAAEPDNPLTSARLRPAQLRLLKQAYEDCYRADGEFRQRVHRLLGLPEPSAEKPGKAPQDLFKLPGERASVPVFEAFYTQAGFMEGIGIRPATLVPQTLNCSGQERLFIEALIPFYRQFESNLQAQGLMTFNAAFQRLSDRLSQPGASLAVDNLKPFSHLLIDEFQDISPQIVQWLQALHGYLARQGESLSLMAIGDDWQSIYGWRGSSPELFMDFDRHFPSQGATGKSALLVLETNYRSIDAVIRDGEKLLKTVACKQEKTCQAFRPTEEGDHGLKVVNGFDINSQLPKLLAVIREQCAHAEARACRERTAVLVLSRRNEPLQTIQAELDKKLPVRAMTIHRAKGLQAEVAIILDDGGTAEKHPLRNALYAHSGFFRNSYDQAMADESQRLAYVAITRGVSRVLWFTRKASRLAG